MMVLWWHWVLLGIVLVLVDLLFINIYYVLWFGCGAVFTGLVLTVFPNLPMVWQVCIFGAASIAFLTIWMRLIQPIYDRKRFIRARAKAPGSAASVIRFSEGKGSLRLQRPLGGKVVWDFVSDGQPRAGDAVVIASLDEDGVMRADPPDGAARE